MNGRRAEIVTEMMGCRSGGRRTLLNPLSEKFVLLLPFLKLHPVAPLHPALARVVAINALPLLERRQECCDTLDLIGVSLLGRMIRGRQVAKGWPWREQREQVRRELVRHRADGLTMQGPRPSV